MTGQPNGKIRRTARSALALAVAVVGVVLPTSAATAEEGGYKTVSYRGYQVSVPASWPVVDLAADSRACVRFDRQAVYLGHPGADQQCASTSVGRTEALLVEPLDATVVDTLEPDAVVVAHGAAPDSVPAPEDGFAQVAVEAAGVLVTGARGTGWDAVSRALTKAVVTGEARPATVEQARARAAARPVAAGDVGTQAVVAPGRFAGEGFDACAAPSSGTMQAWLSSPFRAVGVYIGGSLRACAQPNLTAAWVGEQASRGWHLLPIYVGRQAPCTTYRDRIDPANAAAQGRSAALDAVAAAERVDFAPNSVVYYDMEAYTRGSSCSLAVVQYLSAWTEELHRLGYRSGVYSSAASGVTDLVNAYDSGTHTRPDSIWFAEWNGQATTDTRYIPSSYWVQQRVHQYRGDHNETHGGHTVNIDSNRLDVDGSGTPVPNLDFADYPELRQGASGAEVKAAQHLLNTLGHNAGSVDGIFGPTTLAAVRSFQTSTGLASTGVVERGTWTALLSAGTRTTLRNGDRGVAVSRLQRSLTAALDRTVAIDGIFGPGTESAVRDYQSGRGLGVDGIVGAQTWEALQRGR